MSQDKRRDGSGWDDGEIDWLEEFIEDKAPQEAPERPARREPAADDWERTRAGSAPRRERIRAGEPEEEPEYRRGQRRKANVPLILVIVLLVGGMIFAGWQLGSIFLNYHRDRSAYSELASSAISALPAASGAGGREAEAEEESEQYAVTRVPISVDWDYLHSINSEIVGWLYCPGTIINYPVVQASDNDFYLDHGFDRQTNNSGALFVDVDSAEGIAQSNYIIYGHNMKDKSMFGSFQEYVNESYYRENPTMYYLTPNAAYRVDLFGAHVVEGTVDNYPTFFSGSYQSYLDGVSDTFFWINRSAINTDYQMMTLSTCTSAQNYADARLVLHGTMIPIE